MNGNVVAADTLIGMTVLSRTTGNRLGEVSDLYIDPIEGLLKGLTIRTENGKLGGIDYKDIYNFGQDAVMAEHDDAVVPINDEWIEGHPHAKKHLLGVKIVTESGNLLGNVGDIFVSLAAPPSVIYEVRDSVFDKLLGRSFYILAASGKALSNNAERIVVPDDASARASKSLSELAARAAGGTGNIPTEAPKRRSAIINHETRDDEDPITS